MNARRNDRRRRATRPLLAVALVLAAALAASPPASAATTATFANGVLTVTGDAANNSIVLSRNAVGRILVNNGAIAVVGGTPTVANTALIRAFGQAATTPSASTRSTARCRGRTCSAAPTTTLSPAAPVTTSSSARPATTPSWARAASTSSPAAARTTRSPVATPTIKPSVRAATTG